MTIERLSDFGDEKLHIKSLVVFIFYTVNDRIIDLKMRVLLSSVNT